MPGTAVEWFEYHPTAVLYLYWAAVKQRNEENGTFSGYYRSLG